MYLKTSRNTYWSVLVATLLLRLQQEYGEHSRPRPWLFVVDTKKDTLNERTGVNGRGLVEIVRSFTRAFPTLYGLLHHEFGALFIRDKNLCHYHPFFLWEILFKNNFNLPHLDYKMNGYQILGQSSKRSFCVYSH